MGFGGGALIASPLSEQSCSTGLRVDTPPTRSCRAFLTLGSVYLVVMMLGAFTVRVPADDWGPEGWVTPTEATAALLQTTADVTAATAIRTPQFWLLWIVLFCNVTAGIGILEQAAPMIQDFFSDDRRGGGGGLRRPAVAGQHGRAGSSGPRPPTSSAASRSTWCYLGIGAVLYCFLVAVGDRLDRAVRGPAGVIISFYGGGFATDPRLPEGPLRRLEVGAIHGRLLTAWCGGGRGGTR